MSTQNARRDEYMHFLAYMGVALTAWANVEEAHFLIFRMMRDTKKEICSVIYFSSPSFESRRVMVDRVAHFFISDENMKEWAKLTDELQKASGLRGQLAHYGLDFELLKNETNDDGAPSLEFGAPRLRPSSYNEVHIMQGKTGEKHTVTVKKLRLYAETFSDLERRLQDFNIRMTEQVPPRVGLWSGLLLGDAVPDPRPPLPLEKGASDDEGSGS